MKFRGVLKNPHTSTEYLLMKKLLIYKAFQSFEMHIMKASEGN